MKRYIRAVVTALLMAALLMPVGAQAAEKEIPISEEYMASEFGQRLAGVELTGSWRTDIVNVALSCVGYHEGDSAGDYAGGNFAGSGNFTEYSSVFYGINAQWCAIFVSWCARQAGIPRYIINSASRAATDGAGGTAKYYFHLNSKKAANYSPVTGDIVFFSHSGWGTDHVGIVARVTDTGIYTVEGNCLNSVRLNYYDFDDESIVRYGIYAQEEQTDILPFTGATLRFINSEGGHGQTPEGPEYSFTGLMAMEGRLITIPGGAFAREGYTLAGYCARRCDTDQWYTAGGWVDREELLEAHRRPDIIPDGHTWRYEELWQGVAEAELYCVWQTAKGSYIYDSAMPVFNQPDEDGWVNPFSDVLLEDWYYTIVKKAGMNGLISGTEEHRFYPGADCGRASFVTWLYCAAGLPDTGEAENPFADVAGEDEEAVKWAYSKGLVYGIGENEFGPERPLTREQAAVILHRMAGQPRPLGEADFVDAGEISPWASQAVAWAQERGIIAGVPAEGGMAFQPKRNLKRSEALSLVTRLDMTDID